MTSIRPLPLQPTPPLVLPQKPPKGPAKPDNPAVAQPAPAKTQQAFLESIKPALANKPIAEFTKLFSPPPQGLDLFSFNPSTAKGTGTTQRYYTEKDPSTNKRFLAIPGANRFRYEVVYNPHLPADKRFSVKDTRANGAGVNEIGAGLEKGQSRVNVHFTWNNNRPIRNDATIGKVISNPKNIPAAVDAVVSDPIPVLLSASGIPGASHLEEPIKNLVSPPVNRGDISAPSKLQSAKEIFLDRMNREVFKNPSEQTKEALKSATFKVQTGGSNNHPQTVTFDELFQAASLHEHIKQYPGEGSFIQDWVNNMPLLAKGGPLHFLIEQPGGDERRPVEILFDEKHRISQDGVNNNVDFGNIYYDAQGRGIKQQLTDEYNAFVQEHAPKHASEMEKAYPKLIEGLAEKGKLDPHVAHAILHEGLQGKTLSIDGKTAPGLLVYHDPNQEGRLWLVNISHTPSAKHFDSQRELNKYIANNWHKGDKVNEYFADRDAKEIPNTKTVKVQQLTGGASNHHSNLGVRNAYRTVEQEHPKGPGDYKVELGSETTIKERAYAVFASHVDDQLHQEQESFTTPQELVDKAAEEDAKQVANFIIGMLPPAQFVKGLVELAEGKSSEGWQDLAWGALGMLGPEFAAEGEVIEAAENTVRAFDGEANAWGAVSRTAEEAGVKEIPGLTPTDKKYFGGFDVYKAQDVTHGEAREIEVYRIGKYQEDGTVKDHFYRHEPAHADEEGFHVRQGSGHGREVYLKKDGTVEQPLLRGGGNSPTKPVEPNGGANNNESEAITEHNGNEDVDEIAEEAVEEETEQVDDSNSEAGELTSEELDRFIDKVQEDLDKSNLNIAEKIAAERNLSPTAHFVQQAPGLIRQYLNGEMTILELLAQVPNF